VDEEEGDFFGRGERVVFASKSGAVFQPKARLQQVPPEVFRRSVAVSIGNVLLSISLTAVGGTLSQAATDFVTATGRQIDLLSTLALATIAGTMAAALQIALHNANAEGSGITLTAGWLVYTSLLLELASILAGFISKGHLTAAIPNLHILKVDECWSTNMKRFETIQSMSRAAQIQFGALILGVLLLIGFVFANRGAL
jgi:hypothetical protein